MNATEAVDLHKKIDFSRHLKVIEICKRIQIADSFLNIFRSKTCQYVLCIQS